MKNQRAQFEFDRYGMVKPKVDTSGMLSPVRCNHCGEVYDLCAGKPVARYADCTVYITPCCNRQVDDRPAGWVSSPAFTRLDRS